MGCLGTQMGGGGGRQKEDKKGKREKKENKQTNEQWGSQDRDEATRQNKQRRGGLTDAAGVRAMSGR